VKKIWKCPRCVQISTRHGNLKRHIERKHSSRGKPILQYVSGNSIFTPSIAPPHAYTVQDDYDIFGRTQKDHIFYSNSSQMKNNYDLSDKYVDRFFQFMDLQLKIDSTNQSLNVNPLNHFRPPPPQFHSSFISKPVYMIADQSSEYRDKISRKYDNVIGFGVVICHKCLTIIISEIGSGSQNIRIQDIHKCDPSIANAIQKLDSRQYTIDFLSKVNKFREILFEKCKDWANNTTCKLYLIARKVGSSDENQKEEIRENYEGLRWLNRALAKSYIILSDAELREFLKFTKYQTMTFVTTKGKSGQQNFKYMIAISNIS
jgi:hypothetical protein